MGSGGSHVVRETLAVNSMAADFNSEPAHVDDFRSAFFEFIWSGADAADGEVCLYASADGDPDNLVNWYKLEAFCCTLAAGSGIDAMEIAELERMPYSHIRAQFTSNSNTAGTLTIKVRKKNSRA